MRSMKKMYATMLTIAMIAGMTADVMAVLAAEQEQIVEVEETAVVTDDDVIVTPAEEADVISDEEPAPLGGISKTSGTGTSSDPWNLEFGEELTYRGEEGAEHYYTFTPSKDGVITIEGFAEKGASHAPRLSLYEAGNSSELITKKIMDRDAETYEKLCCIGVKKGVTYQVYVSVDRSPAVETFEHYAFKISFEGSDMWESEPDSKDSCKDIVINKTYYGSLGMTEDPADYYHFKLAKKSKVSLYLKSPYSAHIALYRSQSFGDDSFIESTWNNTEWKMVYESDTAFDAGDYYLKIDGSGSPDNEYEFQVKADSSAGEPVTAKSKTSGSGTTSDPWNIAFDEVTEGEITRPEDASGSADTAQYYHFKLTKDTKLEIALKSPGSAHMDISKKKDFKDPMGYIDNAPGIGKSLVFKFFAGDYYLKINAKDPGTTSYQITVKNMGGSPKTGTVLLNGAVADSLKVAFANINDASMDYTVDLQSDMIGEKNLTIPAKAKSVTINGNGHTINIIGTKLTSGADLTLNDVTIQAVTAKNAKAKFTLTAKKGLNIGGNVVFDTAQTDIKATGNVTIGQDITAASLTGKDVVLNGNSDFSKVSCKALEVRKDLTAPKVTCTDLNLNGTLTTDMLSCNNAAITGTGIIKTSAKGKYTVKKMLIGEGGKIELCAGFKTPIALNGTAEGTIIFTSASAEDGSKVTFADGTQIIKSAPKKITADTLKKVFDISAISTSGTEGVSSHLYYAGGSKACVFADSIDYNGKTYGVWNDVISQMNTDKKSGTKAFTVTLNSDVILNGAFKLPGKGYDSLTIEGNGHKMTFTGDIKLTGNTTIKDVQFNKVDKKNNKVAGKIVKGKFEYTGPNDSALTL